MAADTIPDSKSAATPKKGQRVLADLTGRTFDRLTVIDRAADHIQASGRRRTQWNCLCQCGQEIVVSADNLTNKHTKSCGCLLLEAMHSRRGKGHPQFKHGYSRSREYSSWNQAKQRTTDPNHAKYASYGGRGIRMAKEWVDDFPAFFEHMGFRPPGTTLDRIDNDRGYEPGNCRWATAKEQARNTRSNVLIEVDGTKKTVGEWSETSGIPEKRIWCRMHRDGWDGKRAVFTPLKR